ncbi:MAG: response regulator [Bacteroidales bacterium]|nr:response regulator [Bacteroidales bacterium]
MKLHNFIALLILVSLTSCSNTQTDEPIDTYPDVVISSSLSNQQIMCMAQDSDGYIWFGTYRGLNRFNGHEMRQYFCTDAPNSLPDNQVRAMHTDRNGRLWVATKNGVALYSHNDDFEKVKVKSKNDFCSHIVENRRGDIFAIQMGDVLRYDSTQNALVTVISNVMPATDFVRATFIDSEDNLWIVSHNQIICYSSQTLKHIETLDFAPNEIGIATLIGDEIWMTRKNEIAIYNVLQRKWQPQPQCITNRAALRNVNVSCISSLSQGNILIATTSGLWVFDSEKGKLINQNDADFPFEAPSIIVTQTFIDTDENLWLCSSSQGYVVVPHERKLFNSDSYLRTAFSGKAVASVAYGSSNMLWLATQIDGLYGYNVSTRTITHYDIAALVPNLNTSKYRIIYIFSDSKGDLWLSCAPGGLIHLHHNNGRLSYAGSYPINLAIVIGEDNDGTIWVGCYNNTFYSKRATNNHFEAHQILGNTFYYMSCMRQLSNGRFATLIKNQGLRCVNNDAMHKLDEPLIPDSVLSSCIKRSVFLPSALLEDRKGDLWIGTVSNGLLHYNMHTKELTTIDGTACNDISSIEEDDEGSLWISTLFGLTKHDPNTNTTINYYKSDGIGGNEFYDRASAHLPDGTLIFGGAHGLTVFNPKTLTDYPQTRLYLEDLKVHNRIVRPEYGSCISTSLSKAKEINLNYKQNSFSISFAALDFGGDERFCYQYKLDGFNAYWIDAHNAREAFYANLRPCSYKFNVRITNKDRTLVIAERSIVVNIIPAPWNTWWAKLIYVCLLVGLILFIARLFIRLKLEHWTLLQAERERERERHINKMNMSFFANVSHEFRTPLTIIAGPIAQLTADETLTTEQRNLLKIVQSSVSRMLRLVNQMMDFHRLEDDALRLEVARHDIIGLLRQALSMFTMQAKEKEITIVTHGVEDSCIMWLDPDKVDKIICNLLGNAVKYTPQGGRIDFCFDVVTRQAALDEHPDLPNDGCTRYVKIAVANTGQSINADDLTRIFERYYQIRRQAQGQFNWGTGVGLYYAKRLVSMHHGCIKAENSSDGVVFSFVLPVTDTAYTDEEKVQGGAPTQSALYPLADVVDDTNAEQQPDEDKRTIMVIDDDVEIVHYVKTLLTPTYNVVSRFDAESAINCIREKAPDLVMSDVMMQGKDGFELCREIKNDLQLCHIPVVLVTARTTTTDQIKGLGTGADAYVTKPFDPAYLQALINSIMQNRDKVRHILGSSTQTDTLETDTLSPQDNAFMTELYKIMEAELSNSDLDVSHMTDMLRISRTKLYYKVKGLTGENPSAFFRRYKLNRAAELIKEGRYNMSEIADLTGFSSLSHFSTSFKKQFGTNPSEYK